MTTPHPRARPAPRLLEYTLGDGWLVLVGKTEADNDELSLRIAEPNRLAHQRFREYALRINTTLVNVRNQR